MANVSVEMRGSTRPSLGKMDTQSLVTPGPIATPRPRAVRCSMRNIWKSYGATPVLKGVDVRVPEGTFGVLVGPSGCGKSTLLRLVAGLEEPTEGTVELAGRDVTDLPPRDRDVAMVFQNYALYPHLTVRENMAFGLKLRRSSEKEIEARIAEVSGMLGLELLLDRLPKQLSGGQRQRVAMGRALVRSAQMYLFDEPLSNLDAALRAEVRIEIRKLHDRIGATTLYVTHDQVEAMTLADTLWVLNKGKVEQTGAPLDVYERPRTTFVAGFLGSPNMNMVEGVLARRGGQWIAEGGSVTTPVSADRFGNALAEGRAVLMGIRPQDLELARPDAAIATLKVEFVEALGFEAFGYGWFRVSGPRIVAKLPAEAARRVRTGDAVPVTVDPDRVHLFDPKSGLALDVADS